MHTDAYHDAVQARMVNQILDYASSKGIDTSGVVGPNGILDPNDSAALQKLTDILSSTEMNESVVLHLTEQAQDQIFNDILGGTIWPQM